MKMDLAVLKTLREQTGLSVNECRLALESSGGDPGKAREFLQKRHVQLAQKRQGKATTEGRLGSYLHHDGRLAALVEVNCESDYVARTEEFQKFCKDVAMQVAAMSPRYLSLKEVPSTGGQNQNTEALKAACLLEQPFVRDSGVTIHELLQALIAKTGEQVVIQRFVRVAVGESTHASEQPA